MSSFWKLISNCRNLIIVQFQKRACRVEKLPKRNKSATLVFSTQGREEESMLVIKQILTYQITKIYIAEHIKKIPWYTYIIYCIYRSLYHNLPFFWFPNFFYLGIFVISFPDSYLTLTCDYLLATEKNWRTEKYSKYNIWRLLIEKF